MTEKPPTVSPVEHLLLEQRTTNALLARIVNHVSRIAWWLEVIGVLAVISTIVLVLTAVYER